MGEDDYTNAQDEVLETTTGLLPSQTKRQNPLEARVPVDITKPIPIEPDGGMGVGASDIDTRADENDKPSLPTLKELDRLRELSYYGQMLTDDDIDFFSKMMIHPKTNTPFVDPVFAHELDTVKDMVINHDMDFIFCTDGCLVHSQKIDVNNKSLSLSKVFKLYNDKIFKVASYDLALNKITDGNARVFKTGKKMVYEIETEDGRKIQATKEHTFFIERDGAIIELPLSDLCKGDKLVCRKR